jgi:hypothetical protein
MGLSHLFLLQLELLRLQKFPRHPDRTVLRTQHQVPQFLAECRSILVQKAGELDLDLLDLRLRMVSSITYT